MTEQLHVRMTSEQKSLFFQAAEVSDTAGGTVSELVSGVLSQVAPFVLALDRGEITPEQFRAVVGEGVLRVVKPSLVSDSEGEGERER